MKRTSFLTLATFGVMIATSVVRGAALADGAMSITNTTIDQAVTVEAKIGNSVDDAIPAGGAVLKKGETGNFPATPMRYFWRREVNPGSNDGKWTGWQTVDSRYGDQRVSF